MEKEGEHNAVHEHKEDSKVLERKERIKIWLKDPYKLIFLGIMIFSIIVNLYYFNLTKDQPLWWDEADYMAYAKNLAGFPVNWEVTSFHNTIFYYFGAFLFKLGFSTATAKFFLEFLPLNLLIFLTYKISNLMYQDKKIALISTFIMATFWELLFNGMRFHLEIPALFFAFLAVYVFFQGHEKKQKIFIKIDHKWAIPLSVFFAVMTYATRRGYFLFGIMLFVYFVLTKDIKSMIKDKYNWIGLALFLIMIFFIENFIFISSVSELSAYYNDKLPFSLISLDVFKAYFYNVNSAVLSPLYYLFWIGIILIASNIVISIGHFKNTKNSELRSDLFNFIMVFATICFFFITRTQGQGNFGEPRWYFPLLLGSIMAISRGTSIISNYVRKYNKIMSILFIIILIGSGGYYEVKHADMVIKSRINSYNGVKQASLFIKSISTSDDAVFGKSGPQVSFYSERKFAEPDRLLDPDPNKISLEDFLSFLKADKGKDVRYIIITLSENGYPLWMKKLEYASHPQTGQQALAKFEIPFMNSSYDFRTGQQDFQQSQSYGDIEFRLLHTVEDAFVYEVIRNQ